MHMKQWHSRQIVTLSVFLLFTGACSAQTNELEKPLALVNAGKLTKVTLYREQALVTREIRVEASSEEREVLVGRLPDQVVVESVFAEGIGNILIRGVRVGQQATASSNRPEIQELTTALHAIAQEIAELQQKQQTSKKQASYIDNLMNFSSVATTGDLSRGVLDAKSLTELSQFTMDSQEKLSAERFQIEQQLLAATAQQAKLEQQLALLSQSEQPTHEATVTVAAGPQGVFHLSYLVAGCSWEPSYTIHGSTSSDNINLRYNALIQQMSGEDWTQVKLTLSTASPSISAAGPSLTPFRVATTKSPNQRSGSNKLMLSEADLNSSRQLLLQKQNQVANQYSGGFRDDDNLNRDLALNEIANEFQNLELQTDAAQLKSLASDVGSEITSQTYEIATPVRLASRREHHNVLVIEEEMKGQLYHVATPLLSSFAYREALIRNQRPEGLLGGPAAVYLDDKFVGRTELPSTASGQQLIVGFGADQQVRTRRELMSKSEEIQGGNRRLTLRYRLVVANFKKTNLSLRLMDRLPLVGQGSDIKIELNPSNLAVSQDGLYERLQKPRGILRWDINVAPERFGENAHDVEYNFSLSFDRTTHLTNNLADANQIAQDLFESAAPNSRGMGGMGGMGGGMGGMLNGKP